MNSSQSMAPSRHPHGLSTTRSTQRWARRSAPSWGSSKAILLGRTTYEQFAPAWSSRTAEDDPGAEYEANDERGALTGSRTTHSRPAARFTTTSAQFRFDGGLIAEHRDSFSFYTWARQALGPLGLALGWTPILRGKGPTRVDQARGAAAFRVPSSRRVAQAARRGVQAMGWIQAERTVATGRSSRRPRAWRRTSPVVEPGCRVSWRPGAGRESRNGSGSLARQRTPWPGAGRRARA
jgi:hypothetical protein